MLPHGCLADFSAAGRASLFDGRRGDGLGGGARGKKRVGSAAFWKGGTGREEVCKATRASAVGGRQEEG